MRLGITDTLQKARDLIADPDKWCVGTLAMDEQGAPTTPYSPVATRWCLVGSIEKQISDVFLGIGPVIPTLKFATSYIKKEARSYIAEFNDRNTHETVIAMMDEMIEASKGINDEDY